MSPAAAEAPAPGARALAGARVGLVGGGQLGRLLGQAALDLGVELDVLDPDPACPAAPLARRLLTARFDDAAALAELARGCAALGLEIEAPPAELLAALEASGAKVLPGAAVLACIQDKLEQRRFFAAAGLAQPRFAELQGPPAEAVSAFGLDCVVKARRAGYDGRGVLLPQGADDPRLRGWQAPSLLEERVQLAAELAVVVVRGQQGETAAYDPVLLHMDPQLHLLEALEAPAPLAPALLAEARSLALRAVEALGGVGAFGVELFLDREGRLLLNEVSPRVHNSGHHTLEACATSQFENHLRALLGWPLGSPETLKPAALANLVGPAGLRGPYAVAGQAEALALTGLRLHLYGKAETRPGRKLGHLTALAESSALALQRVREARARLRFEEAS